MAINASIFKVDLQVADMDRNYYQGHNLTIARHPSETDERMMVRVLAFAHNAMEGLGFGKGLSTDDEPDLWKKNLVDEIELWIDVGQPDEKRLRRAAGRSKKVLVYAYGGNEVDTWWHQNQRKLNQMEKLGVYQVSQEVSQAMTNLVARTMQLQVTIQDGEILFTDGQNSVETNLIQLKPD